MATGQFTAESLLPFGHVRFGARLGRGELSPPFGADFLFATS
jgi:hypothetical protein